MTTQIESAPEAAPIAEQTDATPEAQRVRDEAELARLQGELAAQRTHLEGEAKRVAQELETNLRGLTEGMLASWETATAAHDKAETLNQLSGTGPTFHPFAEEQLIETLTSASVNEMIIDPLVSALRRFRLVEVMKRGFKVSPDSPATLKAAATGDVMPSPFDGFTVTQSQDVAQ